VIVVVVMAGVDVLERRQAQSLGQRETHLKRGRATHYLIV
jgi:hypothetical protein